MPVPENIPHGPVWAGMPGLNRMTPEIAALLRRQFPPEQIGKLPRGRSELDYVGHADVTSRLLEADPAWTWEPLAYGEDGLPRFDLDERGNPVGLWIKLTVAGVTRLGYGSVPSTQGDAVKVLIGDALRNAAMRFGVAVDLWAKGDRLDPTAENPTGPAAKVSRASKPAKPDLQELVTQAANLTTLDELRKFWEKTGALGMLTREIVLPSSGEKIQFQEYLTQRSAELASKSGPPAGGNGAGENTRTRRGAQ
jgi:hypothetical protein